MLKYLRSYLDFINEGVKIGPDGLAVLSRKDEIGELLSFVNKNTRLTAIGQYSVYYRIESPEKHDFTKEEISDVMKKLKAGQIENAENSVAEFIKPDLIDLARESRTLSGYDYIIQVGSSEGLASIMAKAALKAFPNAKLIELPKIVHPTYYTAVDYKELELSLANGKKSSFEVVRKFIYGKLDKKNNSPELLHAFNNLETIEELNAMLKKDYDERFIVWKPGFTDFKVKKSETTKGNIIRFFNKYDFKNSEFINAINDCASPFTNKYALILDDNVHNKTDFRKIFKVIDAVVKDYAEKIRTLNLSGELSDSDFNRLAYRPKHRNFAAYVLYKIKDADLPKKGETTS